MSQTGRAHNIACRGLLVAVLFFAYPVLAQDNHSLDDNAGKLSESYKKIAPTPEESDTFFWDYSKGEIKNYQSVCKNPYNRSDADLCQKWRMANAMEQQTKHLLEFNKPSDHEASVSIWTWIVRIITLIASVIAAGSAVYAVKTAKKVYQASHRPWIKVTPQIIAPLTWDDGGSGTTTIQFVLENIGNVPATNIFITSKFVIGRSNTQFVVNAQREMSKRAERVTTNGEISAIFPHEKVCSGWGQRIRGKEIADDREFRENKGVSIIVPNINLIGVVRYTNSSDGSNHVTGFCYKIRKIKPAGSSGEIHIFPGENLPVDLLGLYQQPLGPDTIT